MRVSEQYIPLESNAPLRGLATTPASTRLDPAFSPSLLNCVVRDGEVRRRGGYQQLGQRLVGRVLGMVEFGEIDGDEYLVVLTSHRQYAYSTASDSFVDLTPDQTSYAITAVDTNKFTIAGDHTADFPDDRIFPVVGGANEGVYTVATGGAALVGGNTEITVVEALLDEVTVDGDIVIATDFDTDANGLVEYAVLTDVNSHRLLITNGTDTPRVWDGDITGAFADWAPAFDNFVTCKRLAVFSEHLFLGDITTTLGREPQLIAWSDAGDFDEFETGQSGVQLLHLLDDIRALKVLADRLVVYSADAIMTGAYVGGVAVFVFDMVIPEGTRLTSPQSIASINVGHVYLSQENFYLFDGTRGLRVLGDAIYSDYKAVKDQENLFACVTLNDYAKRTLYFAVPNINGGTMVYTAEYDVFDLGRISWGREQYAHNPTAFGFYTNRTESLTWEDASWEPTNTPWEDEIGSWGEESEQIDFPIRAFGTDEGYVFIVTEGVLTDDGTTVTQTYETLDFTMPQAFLSQLGRWGEVEVEASGSDVEVSYSLDRGRNWTVVEEVTLTGTYETYRLPVDAMSRTFRVRFESDTNFRLRWCRVWVRPGGPA